MPPERGGNVDFRAGKSKTSGPYSVGWFPGAIVHDSRRVRIYVANIKGLGPGRERQTDGRPEFNSHQYHGTVSLIRIPAVKELAALTGKAQRNMRYPLLQEAALPARPDQPARPVPERVGEPAFSSTSFTSSKRIAPIDQVLGDLPQGNGDPSLCIFGERITPNQHKISRDFVLLDNTYCSGIQSFQKFVRCSKFQKLEPWRVRWLPMDISSAIIQSV